MRRIRIRKELNTADLMAQALKDAYLKGFKQGRKTRDKDVNKLLDKISELRISREYYMRVGAEQTDKLKAQLAAAHKKINGLQKVITRQEEGERTPQTVIRDALERRRAARSSRQSKREDPFGELKEDT